MPLHDRAEDGPSLAEPEDRKRTAFLALRDSILSDSGRVAPELRARAFAGDVLDGHELPVDQLLRHVTARPPQVTMADISVASAAGLSRDELFELVVCAAVGQSARLYDAGLAALAEAQSGEER